MEKHDPKAIADELKRQQYLQNHREQVFNAQFHLRDYEAQVALTDGREHIKACLRMLLDLHLQGAPSHAIASRYVSYCVLLPQEVRVPFINAVARYSRPPGDDEFYKEWVAFKKKLVGLSNKVAGLVFELDALFAEFQLADPVQLELFKRAIGEEHEDRRSPILQGQQATSIRDDGGIMVDPETGEIDA